MQRYLRVAKVALALYCVDGILRKGWWHGMPQLFFKEDDERMKRILKRMNIQRYMPTFWAHGAYAQLVVFMVYKLLFKNSVSYERHVLSCPDGGHVCVKFVSQTSLEKDAPVVLILHTITGMKHDENELVQYALRKGWRPVLLMRRGHFKDTLSTPRFNIMGEVEDTKLMVNYVAERFPDSFIAAIGVSAGSGAVVSYIGNQDPHLPVKAAVSLCPAYSLKYAFENLQKNSPLCATALLLLLKRFFLHPNHAVLKSTPGFQQALHSRTLPDFVRNACHMAGYDSYEAYLRSSDPTEHISGNKVPCLLVNSTDDPLCLEENISYNLANNTEHFALLLTKSGSHIAYRHGLLGQHSYMHQVAIDFIEAVRENYNTKS
eukprot:CAMPEP_0203752356 /NCGR_PEP_ID=MMETSP0098-20131031/6280_1 /ASSEMBLY_ACC=CAM_ASM_000208 /TAXON_ID=96639 /ORGANISM=" , Strain NY0313808BC1" /LENGTH=374 /DNA_ID=CAMNT_0050642465 /DNA_START=38 /DNA_END=1162 /DNA_ORIENTATION=-